jgi:hypothetical protein
VVVVTFQKDFHLEIYQNNFFKKLFYKSAHQNDLKIPKKINLKQRKKIKKF